MCLHDSFLPGGTTDWAQLQSASVTAQGEAGGQKGLFSSQIPAVNLLLGRFADGFRYSAEYSSRRERKLSVWLQLPASHRGFARNSLYSLLDAFSRFPVLFYLVVRRRDKCL